MIRLSIERPIFISMITIFMIVLGGLAIRRLPVDLYPNVSYPVLAVRANLSGAAPEEIEQLVTKRIEDEVSTLPGIKMLRSISREGSAVVILEFDTSTDIRFQEIQLRAKLANMRNSLPEKMTEPVVYRQDPDDTPIIEIIVQGNRPASVLTKIADDDIAQKIRQINGVGSVDLNGERNPQVLVELKPAALNQWQVNARDVVSAISKFNRNDPVGRLYGERRIWLLRSISQSLNIKELEQIPVLKTTQGGVVLLRDLAELSYGFEDVRRVVRFNNGEVLQPAIQLSVVKQSGENTVAVSDAVQAALPQIQKSLPQDVSITISRDNADLVRSNVADVLESLIIGAILTVIVVLLFLRSPRSTITTGLSIPSSVITSFAVMAVAGFTINVMTLLALSLSIGLLVDDAIVVRENIFRHMQKSTDPREAAYKGTKEVALAVVATTLTIVAVFLPVGFMQGVSGQLFRQFALMVVFAILISLWDAMTMAPMLSAHFANIADPADEWKKFGKFGRKLNTWLLTFEHWFDRLSARYQRTLKYLIERPKIVFLIAVVSLSVAVGGFIVVKKSFLPTQLGAVFSVSLDGPLAIPQDRINETSDEVDKRLRAVKSLKNWTLSAGMGFSGTASVNLTVSVKPENAKSQKSLAAVRQQVRQALNGILGYSVSIREPADPMAGSSGRFQPLAVVVTGQEIDTTRTIANEMRQLMLSTSGIADVGALQDAGLPELRLKTEPSLAAIYNVTADVMSDALQIWVDGDSSNSLRQGDDQIPIRVTLQGGKLMSPSDLLVHNVFVNANGKKQSVPIKNIATLEPDAGAATISRENRARVMRLGGSLASDAALGNVVSDLQEKLDRHPFPQGYSARIVGQSEQMSELFNEIIFAILLGIVFVYMILSSLFESFIQPLTVMAAIPLAATGAVVALLLAGLNLDLYGGIGLILLAGIVAKNGILLVDFAMQRVKAGAEPEAAILETAPLRLRPILMTSIAMVIGMLPIALGIGSGGAARMSLGVATIGGVISSTFLTLVIVPSLFIVIEKLRMRQ